MVDDPLRCQREELFYEVFDYLFIYFCGPFGIDKNTDRLGNSDSIRKLNLAGIGKIGCHNILCDISRHVAGTSIHF